MEKPPSPFAFLAGLFGPLAAAGPQAPQWLVHELRQRVVLFLNHVLMQEPEAMARLLRQKGRVVRVQWRAFSLALLVTPAGLFNLAAEAATPDLRLEVSEASALALARGALRGDRPAIRIEGDVQLATEINWLVEHLRWDLTEDLARVIGDAPAQLLAQSARSVAQALRRFAGGNRADAPAPRPNPPPAPTSDRTGA